MGYLFYTRRTRRMGAELKTESEILWYRCIYSGTWFVAVGVEKYGNFYLENACFGLVG